MTLTIQYIGLLKNQITYDFHININSHQWRFGEGRGRNGSFTFFHIDFPQKCPGSKSTSKAPGLSALCRLSQREEVDCFQLLLLFCFFFLSSWENVNLFRRSFWEVSQLSVPSSCLAVIVPKASERLKCSKSCLCLMMSKASYG